MKKQILALALTLVMAASSVAAQAALTEFKDVKPSDWFYNGVEYVYENGLMNGTGDSLFSPNQTTTRGMIVTIIHRMEGTPAASKANAFADVPAGQWYTKAVAWAAVEGIVTGYSNVQFGPNDTITRQQLAAILFRYAGTCGYDTTGRADLTGFHDVNSDYGPSQLAPWAADAMAWAVDAKLINGTDSVTLSPNGHATRAQVAMILMRFCEKFGEDETPVEPEKPIEPETPPVEPEKPVEPETPPVEPEKPIEPETPPVEPEKPVEPETPPVEPEKPVVPETPPVEPENPVEPETPPVEPEQPVEPETPPVQPEKPGSLTYDEYIKLSGDEQVAYMNSFASVEDFFAWYNDAKAKYDAEQDRIEIGGDGNIDIGDLIGGKTKR